MPRSILFILLGSLGDICRALPVLSLVRAHWPGARISWAVDARWAELAAAHPAADRLLVFPNPRTLSGLAAFIRALRAERPDLALDLQRILKSGVCARLSGARRRLGFHPSDTKEANHWFSNERIPHVSSASSKVTHYLAFARHLGIPVPPRLPFGLDHLADAGRLPAPVATLAARREYVTLVAGSSWPSKDWSADGYRDLAAHVLGGTDLGLAVVGSPAHQRFVAGLPADARIVNLVGRTSLTELAAILGCARAAAGPDTGAGHLAAALGTPYVALTGPTSASRVAPHGCETLVVSSPAGCDGCGRHCRRRAGRCMDAITADLVWARLKQAAETRRPAPQAG